eukprot:jgi/Chlat1/7897/Chrsp66S09165
MEYIMKHAPAPAPGPYWPDMSIFTDSVPKVLIPGACLVGIAFAILLWQLVSRVKVDGTRSSGRDSEDGLLADDPEIVKKVADIQEAISEGAVAFLTEEYRYIGIFMTLFSVVVFLFLSSSSDRPFSRDWAPCADDDTKLCAPSLAVGFFSTVAFVLGALTSTISGFLGMKIATYANARTTLQAQQSIGAAFVTAFRSGAVMGFLLSSLGLLVLYITIAVFKLYFGDDWGTLYECIAGYGLGGSSIALFGRVGGGIYTKAADVGADLVGKVEKDIPEDDPRNPAVIADNVGDNVGDIAGMGADLFGSFAEATCAALVISGLSTLGSQHNFVAMSFPLLRIKDIEPSLKRQLIVSTFLMTPVIFLISHYALPAEFTMKITGAADKVVKNWHVFWCVTSGLWAGLLIGYVTEYFTSNAYTPVQDVADSCRTGAATNIIFGLALGYKSVIIPVFAIAAAIFTSFSFAGMYGIACAALGMLSTLATGLAIDAYGPISDNAGGIAEMAGMGEAVRDRTDALDAAGNTTAAIGKGFAIGSAALVSLALFGAYVTRAGISTVDLLKPLEFCGLLVGAMLPYWFSAMTMKSVGKAALAMVEEVRRQFAEIPGLMEGTARPDYKRCVKISTDASIKEMIPPGALVMLTPVVVGILFGPDALAGVLAGALVSGVQVLTGLSKGSLFAATNLDTSPQMAISSSNTGGAWDNAKKYIEAGASEAARALGGKGSDAHKAAVTGDTVGDPLKDTSGPALNILIKLMAVESLVFAPFFKTHGGIIFKLF